MIHTVKTNRDHSVHQPPSLFLSLSLSLSFSLLFYCVPSGSTGFHRVPSFEIPMTDPPPRRTILPSIASFDLPSPPHIPISHPYLSHYHPIRRLRSGHACDHCRRRKIRCDAHHPACSNCKAALIHCTYSHLSGTIRVSEEEEEEEEVWMKVRKR